MDVPNQEERKKGTPEPACPSDSLTCACLNDRGPAALLIYARLSRQPAGGESKGFLSFFLFAQKERIAIISSGLAYWV